MKVGFPDELVNLIQKFLVVLQRMIRVKSRLGISGRRACLSAALLGLQIKILASLNNYGWRLQLLLREYWLRR